MNNFNPCYNLYYQFCMFPNYIPSHQNYYAPMSFYPHLVPPISNNLIIQNVVPSESISLPIQQAKSEEKVEVKSVKNELAQKQEASKLTVQSEQKTCKQISKKEEGKKANRPLTYLTEKAYYMKQKLKQKQINGIRILRKRLKNKQIRKIKKNEAEKELKMEREKGEKGKKKMPIAKDSEKEQKILYRIKMKLAKQNLNEYAVIPKQISGLTQLNQFCRVKYENLMQRQMNQN